MSYLGRCVHRSLPACTARWFRVSVGELTVLPPRRGACIWRRPTVAPDSGPAAQAAARMTTRAPSTGCEGGMVNCSCELGGGAASTGSILKPSAITLRHRFSTSTTTLPRPGIAEGCIGMGASTRSLLLAGQRSSWPADLRRQEPATARSGLSGRWTVRYSKGNGRASRRIPPANSRRNLRGQGPEPGLTPGRRSPHRTGSGGCARTQNCVVRFSDPRAGCPRRFDRGLSLRYRRRHSACRDDVAASGRAAGIDFRRHPLALGLPVIRLVRRNIVLGSAVMVAGILVGLVLD